MGYFGSLERKKDLTDSMWVELIHRCDFHGTYADGIYCEECETDDDYPHDMWGDKTLRFVISR